jgi:hypothetical protein
MAGAMADDQLAVLRCARPPELGTRHSRTARAPRRPMEDDVLEHLQCCHPYPGFWRSIDKGRLSEDALGIV